MKAPEIIEWLFFCTAAALIDWGIQISSVPTALSRDKVLHDIWHLQSKGTREVFQIPYSAGPATKETYPFMGMYMDT